MDASLDKVGFGSWQVPPILTFSITQFLATVGYISSIFVNQPLNCNFAYNSSLLTPDQSSRENTHFPSLNTSNDANYIFHTCTHHKNNISLMYYNKSIFVNVWSAKESTISSEFNLYGARAWLSPLYQMAFVLGIMLGDLGGNLGDKYGRVFIIRLSTVSITISQLMIPFSPSLSVILVCRVFVGISYSLINVSAYNLVVETTPNKYRTLICTLMGLPYFIGAIILSVSAYFIRNWRILTLCNSIYVIILSASVNILKKSPHWLCQKGRVKDSMNVLKSAYECNKKKSPPENLFLMIEGTDIFNESKPKNKNFLKTFLQTVQSLFRTKNMRIISIIHPIIFSCFGFLYLGISLNANNFTNNPYLYVAVINSFEIIPALFGNQIVKNLGHINSITILSILVATCMMLILVINYWILNWVLVVVAQMSLGLIYLICCILSSQLFPTSLRTTGFGICIFASHFGTFIASYVFDSIARNHPLVPYMISSILSIICAFFVRFLPETFGEPLCENIYHIEERKSKPLGLCFRAEEQNMSNLPMDAYTKLKE